MASQNFNPAVYQGTITRIAGGTITAGMLVKWDSTAGQVVACGTGGVACGIATNDAASGETVTVALPGLLTLVELGGTFTFATECRFKSDSAGKAVVIASNNDAICGTLVPGPLNGTGGVSGNYILALVSVPASHGA